MYQAEQTTGSLPWMLQVLVVGQPAVQTELLFGNYYGKPAGKVTSPLEAIQVWPTLILKDVLNNAGKPRGPRTRWHAFVSWSMKLLVC